MKHATITDATFMDRIADLRSTAKPRGRPMLTVLVSFSAAYFTGALVTDLVYWRMPDVLWERFSIWLIVAGLIMAGLAAIAYVIDLAAAGKSIGRPGLRDRLRARCPALAGKCLRSQPRWLHRGSPDRPDAFRARRCRSLV